MVIAPPERFPSTLLFPPSLLSDVKPILTLEVASFSLSPPLSFGGLLTSSSLCLSSPPSSGLILKCCVGVSSLARCGIPWLWSGGGGGGGRCGSGGGGGGGGLPRGGGRGGGGTGVPGLWEMERPGLHEH